MLNKITKKLINSLILICILISCDSGLGMGAPIDFIPPILEIDYYQNPEYTNNPAVIEGWVYDNIEVSKIIVRDAFNKDRIFAYAEIDRDRNNFRIVNNLLMQRWKAVIHFECEHEGNDHSDPSKKCDNNEKISVEIIAYDKFGNTGDQSIKFVTFMVDLREPMFKNPVIQRSNTRAAPLQSLIFLQDIETLDPNTREIRNLDFLQNGHFWIDTEVVENENYAETIKLYLFDNDEVVYTADYDNYDNKDKRNPFAPKWTIKEEDIISGGDAKDLNYSARKANNERFYLRVRLEATDLALNTGDKVLNNQDQEILIYDYGFLCLYPNADIPKAKRTGGLQDEIPPGTEIPIEIYDDDLIDVAYAELLTVGQFNDYGADDTARLTAIRNKLIAGETVHNWRKSALYDYPDTPDMRNVFTNRVIPEGADYESIITMVKTGSNVADCGEFKLVVFVKDKKSAPHPANYESLWGSYVFDFTVTDNNAALIVIDTSDLTFDNIAGASSGKSPQENTFPDLDDGKYFSISGYTLDEFSSAAPDLTGYVDIFRLAWIPHRLVLQHGQDNIVKQVRDAMVTQADNPDSASSSLYPAGVQHWTLPHLATYGGQDSYFIKGTNHTINGITYTKQTFKKKFNIFGDTTDDLNSNYYNFHNGTNSGCTGGVHNDGCFENEPKIFVIYVKNKTGLATYRTIRLLGNKNPPDIKIYDLTNIPELSGADYSGMPLAIYNLFKNTLTNTSIVPNKNDYEMASFNSYMEMSRLKVFVEAQPANGVEITDVAMYDITNADVLIEEGAPLPSGGIGYTNSVDKAISYTNVLSETGQKVYKVYARNRLGQHVQIQRTVAVSNTARLVSITTPQQEGVYYSKDTVIELSAQFSSPVKVRRATASTQRPLLNLRYETNGKGSDVWRYTTAEFSGDFSQTLGGESEASMYLQFHWKVPADAHGRLQTVDSGNAQGNYDRPIFLNTAFILEASGDENVSLPGNGEPGGYSLSWINNPGNLQGSKEILLDGIQPVLNNFIIGGKNRYAADDNTGGKAQWYYFGPSDVITFELSATKPIRNDGRPAIQFRIEKPDGGIDPKVFSAVTVLPVGNGLRFSINAGDIDIDGEIVDISITETSGARIIDGNFNTLDSDNLSSLVTALNYALIVDNTRPPCNNNAHSQEDECAAGAQLRLAGSSPLPFYNTNPVITIINRATETQEPWGVFTQYSLDGGATYYTLNNPPQSSDEKPAGVSFHPGSPNTITLNSSGANPWRLRVRQTDKAGNISNQSKIYEVEVEANFPQLQFANVKEARGIYRGGDTLTFTLDFARPVRVMTGSTSHIHVGAAGSSNISDVAQDDLIRLNVSTPATDGTLPSHYSTTVTYTWNITANSKHMPNGIRIVRVDMSGVVDRFGNEGILYVGQVADNGTIAFTHPSAHNVNNITGANHDVITFIPKLSKTESRPASGTNLNTSAIVMTNRNELHLVFDREVRKEIGKIIVRPRTNFPIPPVLPAESYMEDGARHSSFFEIYNSSNIDEYAAATAGVTAEQLRRYLQVQENILANGNTTTNTDQNRVTDNKGKNLITGQDWGPYKLTTQGLISGNGRSAPGSTFSGTSTSPSTTNAQDAVSTSSGFMVPDTRAKYVLDYQYNINDTNGMVANIRRALTAAKFRWEEIDVNSSNVRIYASEPNIGTPVTDGKAVVVILPYSLPKGLQWELVFEDDLFVDKAGNVAIIEEGGYWFWTEGVRAPVIRVDRKSLDYRDRTGHELSLPTEIKNVQYSASTTKQFYYNINHFNYARFKIESETPGAVILYNTMRGQSQRTDDTNDTRQGTGVLANAAVEAAWTGAVRTGSINWNYIGSNTDGGNYTNFNQANDTNGTWILPNLVYRAVSRKTFETSKDILQSALGVVYSSGPVIRGRGNYWGFRSYNSDATLAQLNALNLELTTGRAANTIGITLTNGESALSSNESALNIHGGGTYAYMRASKNYVVAQATVTQGGITTPAVKGYEGIFKTVVTINTGSNNSSGKIFTTKSDVSIYGSNNIGDASIPGFPIQLMTDDWRYIKLPYRDGGNNSDYRCWITTEIVSQVYFSVATPQNNSNPRSRAFNQCGDVDSYLSGGYGELTYTNNLDLHVSNNNLKNIPVALRPFPYGEAPF